MLKYQTVGDVGNVEGVYDGNTAAVTDVDVGNVAVTGVAVTGVAVTGVAVTGVAVAVAGANCGVITFPFASTKLDG